MPRELREVFVTGPSAHSWEEEGDAESLFQDSDVAIFVPLTSQVQYIGTM
jgi:hypothetical protein